MKRTATRRKRPPRAFTLVELLVVITVIGILMGMLLPAVSAINESSRNSRCKNNLRQIGLAMRSHCEKRGVFPTGGICPWPAIDDYLTKEKVPWGPERQGLGWAFQILPYIEMETAFNIGELPAREVASEGYQSMLQKVLVPFYFCPTRRRPTLRENDPGPPQFGAAMLNDYASATPADFPENQKSYIFTPSDPNDLYRGEDPSRVASGKKYNGVVVRTCAQPKGGAAVKSTQPTTLAKIRDGLGFTIMVGEKRVEKDHYFSGEATYDDRGWSDGWSPNIVRSTGFPPGPDIIADTDEDRKQIGFGFGAAHSGQFNAVFADGHASGLSYNIDRTLFNALGHREDYYNIDETQL